MREPPIIIKRSNIQGRGIFAKRFFRKNQTLFIAEGPVIHYPKLYDWRLGPHWINVGKDLWMVPSSKSLWRYTNHSCNPNAIITTGQRFVALRSIHRGDEITIDYSFTESYKPWHMACRCRAKECRSMIRCIQYLPEPLFQKYKRFVQPFLRREYRSNKIEIVTRRNRNIVATKRQIRKGEAIFMVEGPIISYKKAPNYWLGYRWLGVGVNTWMIPEEQNPWNILRHSCDPNVGLNDAHQVIALRIVKQNEELTIDNSMTEADPHWKMRCRCGAKKCRGIVRSIQYLTKKTFAGYLPYIPTFLQHVYRAEYREL